ncbi:MAG: hypothetical protein AABY22_19920 [Nanoarchaeota archaeon]
MKIKIIKSGFVYYNSDCFYNLTRTLYVFDSILSNDPYCFKVFFHKKDKSVYYKTVDKNKLFLDEELRIPLIIRK